MPPVLVVDDEPEMRKLMARWLRSSGYPVHLAGTAEDALAAHQVTPVAVAVCDIRLPGHDGVWLAEQFRRRYPDTAIVMATGMPDVDTAVAGLRQGVIDYLRKPFTRAEVAGAVARGIERFRAAVAARQPAALPVPTREEVACPSLDTSSVLTRVLAAVAREDAAVVERARRVGALSTVLARRLAIPEPGLTVIGQAALLYGLGSRVPTELVDGSWRYAAATMVVVDAIPEWFDGSGSPHGLKRSEISPASRVIAVVGAYDAMTHPLGDREATTPAAAVEAIEKRAGTQFDPRVVNALANTIPTS